MPSEKRARKRAARDAKMAELQRQQRRRTTTRRTITIVVIVGLVVGIYVLVKGKSTKTVPSAQEVADTKAVAAGCPSDPKSHLSKPSWSQPPAMTIDTTKTYAATIKTDAGSFVVSLDAQHAPKTVNNFVFLADHHYFDCVTFHRVIPNFMNQTGDPTGTGSGTPGYKFADELPAPANPQYPIGSVAMANSGPNTNGSQFFIVTGTEGESLPANYTLFGKVTEGMAVADAINRDGNSNPSASGVPPKVIHRMLSVTVTTT
jgi:cyclophilin family peptidyl-prolyl cis-trans isomerase